MNSELRQSVKIKTYKTDYIDWIECQHCGYIISRNHYADDQILKMFEAHLIKNDLHKYE